LFTLSIVYVLKVYASAYLHECPTCWHPYGTCTGLNSRQLMYDKYLNHKKKYRELYFFGVTYTSLPAAAKIPTLSSYSMHKTALEQRPTVATHLSVLTSHIFTVPSWDAVNTRSPESVRTQLTYTVF
jgi:hypothetical protein